MIRNFLFALMLIASCSCTKADIDPPLTEDPETDNPTESIIEVPNEENNDDEQSNNSNYCAEINGVSFESPPNPCTSEDLSHIASKVNGGWIALSPFAFSQVGSPNVTFNSGQWWGETTEGTRILCDYATNNNLKIMIKPQVWMWNSWVGFYDLETEEQWLEWEAAYENYIMTFAEIAVEKNADIFCVGTEYKIAAVQRETFFRNLIAKVREIYSGKVVYAANWDNYNFIPFWDALDYVGIDSYFPLVNQKTPTVEQVVEGWGNWIGTIENFSNQTGKQILFTEYGYLSCDYSAWQNWELEGTLDQVDVNMEAQKNAFEGFFQSFWSEEWFAGGFIWKWFPNHDSAGGPTHKEYTPQRKTAQETIFEWYGR